MAGTNFKCKVCGKEYYCCEMGLNKFPWKQIVCSKECWQQWLSKVNKADKATEVEVVEEPVLETVEEVVETVEDAQPIITEEAPVAYTARKKVK